MQAGYSLSLAAARFESGLGATTRWPASAPVDRWLRAAAQGPVAAKKHKDDGPAARLADGASGAGG